MDSAADDDDPNDYDSSLERAQSDVELVCAAYPDEASLRSPANNHFPLTVTLRLSETAHLVLELRAGYPTESGVTCATSSFHPSEAARVERVVHQVRQVAQECLAEQVEGLLACAAAALEVWNDSDKDENGGASGNDPPTDQDTKNAVSSNTDLQSNDSQQPRQPKQPFEWYTGQPFSVQKSTFVGHVCFISSQDEVPLAMAELMNGNSKKLHRASHNMMAYRLKWVPETKAENPNNNATTTTTTPRTTRVVQDNDEDGEGGAGARLSALLELRHETNVLVVVSRWFGGIHLGPKRFAYISNVARQALDEYHELRRQKDSGSGGSNGKR